MGAVCCKQEDGLALKLGPSLAHDADAAVRLAQREVGDGAEHIAAQAGEGGGRLNLFLCGLRLLVRQKLFLQLNSVAQD